jgi:ribosome-associated protein
MNIQTTTNSNSQTKSSLQQALMALDAALDKKALEPVLLDVSGQSSYTDYILLLSGRSDRHVQHVAEGVVEAFATSLRRKPIGMEGEKEGRWVLIDFGELIVHVFYHPLRDFYDLEGLWCDAERVELDVPAEARATAGQIY